MKGGIWQQKASENTYGERGKKTDWPKEMRHRPEADCRSSACFLFRHSHPLGLTGRCLISEWWETLWELSCFFWQAPIFTNVPFAQRGIHLQLPFTTEWNATQGIIKGRPSRGKSSGWANLLGWGRKSESCFLLQPNHPVSSRGSELLDQHPVLVLNVPLHEGGQPTKKRTQRGQEGRRKERFLLGC